jgi:hypothetical protein
MYVDGIYISDMGNTGTGAAYTINPHMVFGAQNNNGSLANFAQFYFVAFSAYDVELTSEQVSALNTAMNAL